jgi:predicted Zn finger-like uncharacterized protein
MSEPFTTQCPHCESQMRIKNSSIIGKKAPCPKCGERFVVQPMDEAPADDEFDFGGSNDDYGDEDNGDDDDATFRSSSSSPKREKSSKSRPKKRRRKSQSDMSGLLIKGAGILAVVVVVGAGIFGITKLMGGGGSPPQMAWLPNDTDMLLQIRVADLMAAPVIKKVVEDPALAVAIEAMSSQSGLQASEIDRISVGFTDFRSMSQLGATPKFSGVATLRSPVKVDAWLEKKKSIPGATLSAEDYSGRQLHFLEGMGDRVGYCFIDDKTVVFGDEATVKKSLDAGGTCTASSRFAWANGDQQILFAVAPADLTVFDQNGQMIPMQGLFGQQSMKKMSEVFRGFSASLSFANDITVVGGVRLDSSGNARDAARDIQDGVRQSSQMIALARSKGQGGGDIPMMAMMMGGGADRIYGHLETALKGARGRSSGDVCTLTLNLDGAIVDDLKPMIGMAAAMGAMPGGPPNFGAPSQFGAPETTAPPTGPPGFDPSAFQNPPTEPPATPPAN